MEYLLMKTHIDKSSKKIASGIGAINFVPKPTLQVYTTQRGSKQLNFV